MSAGPAGVDVGALLAKVGLQVTDTSEKVRRFSAPCVLEWLPLPCVSGREYAGWCSLAAARGQAACCPQCTACCGPSEGIAGRPASPRHRSDSGEPKPSNFSVPSHPMPRTLCAQVGTFAIAYAAHKALSPVRFPPTVALTPLVARWLGREPATNSVDQ